MPEGDTIYRTAVRLRAVLAGRPVGRAHAQDSTLAAPSLAGHVVQTITTRGKHLLVHTDRSVILHSHLGMWGSWHVYQPGEPWRKPARQAAMVLETTDAVCVCFRPKTLEILSEAGLRRHPQIQRLGPDILDEALDETQIIQRMRIHNRTKIGEAVMNQTIVCGIGNVYKSETLFLTRLNPFVPVGQLPDEGVLKLVRMARRLMKKNLDGYPRRTRIGRDGKRVWVYRRAGQTCFVCGMRIESTRQGDLGRSTYWCPNCQAP